jgi:hypothetical protein
MPLNVARHWVRWRTDEQGRLLVLCAVVPSNSRHSRIIHQCLSQMQIRMTGSIRFGGHAEGSFP